MHHDENSDDVARGNDGNVSREIQGDHSQWHRLDTEKGFLDKITRRPYGRDKTQGGGAEADDRGTVFFLNVWLFSRNSKMLDG